MKVGAQVISSFSKAVAIRDSLLNRLEVYSLERNKDVGLLKDIFVGKPDMSPIFEGLSEMERRSAEKRQKHLTNQATYWREQAIVIRRKGNNWPEWTEAQIADYKALFFEECAKRNCAPKRAKPCDERMAIFVNPSLYRGFVCCRYAISNRGCPR